MGIAGCCFTRPLGCVHMGLPRPDSAEKAGAAVCVGLPARGR